MVKISVIVIVHDRVDFIGRAVDSVLENLNDFTDYEVIVVKYANNIQIIDLLNSRPVKVISCPEVSPAEKLIAGIEASEGEVLLFLEDDDIFKPEKLEKVKGLFENHPDAIYLHNSYETIDESGMNIAGMDASMRDRTSHLVKRDGRVKSLSGLISKNMFFNLSCCSVKRDLILENKQILLETPFSLDFLIFLLAYRSGKTMIFTPEAYTLYRRHSSYSNDTASFEGFISTATRSDEAYLKDIERMIRYFRESDISDVIQAQSLRFLAASMILRGGWSFSDKINTAINLWKLTVKTGMSHFYKIVLALIFSSVFPSLSKKAIYIYRKGLS